jgi:hypothetical protein
VPAPVETRLPNLPASQLQIVDQPADLGLVDSVLSSITGQFFGW